MMNGAGQGEPSILHYSRGRNAEVSVASPRAGFVQEGRQMPSQGKKGGYKVIKRGKKIFPKKAMAPHFINFWLV